MANELKDIKISLISLVGKAANKTTFIYKSADTSLPLLRGEDPLFKFDIKKQDEEKHLVYGIVYSVNKLDTQGDFATAEEVEKAAHLFMKSLNSTAKVDTQHNLQIADGINIVESGIVRKNDPLFPDDEGAWAIAVKVENDEIWKGVKDGTYTGFSMYGEAKRIPQADEVEKEEKFIQKIIKSLKKYLPFMEDKNIKLVKDFNSIVSTREVGDFIWALRDSIDQVNMDDTVTDKKAAILANIDQFRAKVETITLAKTEIADMCMTDGEVDIEKAGKVLSDANLTKLSNALAAIQSIIESATIQKSKHNKPMENLTKEQEIAAAVEKAKADAKTEHDAEVKKNTDKIAELEAEIEKMKKASPGSGQDLGDNDPAKKVEKGDGKFKFLGH